MRGVKSGISKSCPICGKEFFAPDWRTVRGHGIHCSRACRHASMIGVKTWNSGLRGWKRGPNKSGFKPAHCWKKGHIPWNKGKSHMSGQNHPAWKGDDVGYGGVHIWIKSHYGKPNRCEICGTITAKKYNWSNRSGEYKRDREDWQMACIPCHRKYDNWVEKMLATRTKNKITKEQYDELMKHEPNENE